MPNGTVDLARFIDEHPISRLQVMVFLLCACVVFLDGVDTQVIGIAAPLISREQGIPPGLLGFIFSAGTLGATVGALTCGLLADKFGRKSILVFATILFGVLSLGTAFANGFNELLAVRLLTGLGLGGAVPCVVALTSEYAPAPRRAAIISLLWAAFPLGGMFGGLINAYLLGVSSWRLLFIIWGFMPILTALALIRWLPESVSFILAREAESLELRRIVARIAPDVPAEGIIFATREDLPKEFRLRSLFSGGVLKQTLLLWVATFVVFSMLMIITVWTPALLTSLGFKPTDAALVVAILGFGSFSGTSIAGYLMDRVGASRCLPLAFGLAAVGCALYGRGSSSFTAIAFTGFFAAAMLGLASSGTVALSAMVYPTSVRSTGIGWALGLGRFGQVLGPALVGGMITLQWPFPQIWLVLGCGSLIAAPCVWLLASSKAAFHDAVVGQAIDPNGVAKTAGRP